MFGRGTGSMRTDGNTNLLRKCDALQKKINRFTKIQNHMTRNTSVIIANYTQKLQKSTFKNNTNQNITSDKITPESFQITLYFCNRLGD